MSDLASFDNWINSLTRLFPCRDLNHGPPAPQSNALPIELSWLDLLLKSLIFDIVTQIPWCSNIKSPFCKIHCFDIQTKHEWLHPVSRLYLLGKLFKFLSFSLFVSKQEIQDNWFMVGFRLTIRKELRFWVKHFSKNYFRFELGTFRFQTQHSTTELTRHTV